MSDHLRVLTYNIHKGFAFGGRDFTLRRMREEFRRLRPDIVFLQEVHGQQEELRRKVDGWPSASQFEFLAEQLWPHFAYGKNAVYSDGHHGNAILSKFPIRRWENLDLSRNRIERRGVLHAELDVPGDFGAIHAFCTHLGLLERDRRHQLHQILRRITSNTPSNARLIAAGDFNDWRKTASRSFKTELDMSEVFLEKTGAYATTFPSWYPLLSLDRIYTRGFKPLRCKVLDQGGWTGLSDHLALWADLAISDSIRESTSEIFSPKER